MPHLRAPGGGGQGGPAGIGEEVQNPHRPPGALHLPADVVPVGRLLRKNSGVLKIHGLDVKGEPVRVVQQPALRQVPDLPPAAAGGGAVVLGVEPAPAGSARSVAQITWGSGRTRSFPAQLSRRKPSVASRSSYSFQLLGYPPHGPPPNSVPPPVSGGPAGSVGVVCVSGGVVSVGLFCSSTVFLVCRVQVLRSVYWNDE